MLGLVGLTFAACNNEEDVASNGSEDGKVRITLSLGRTETTRGLDKTAVGMYNNITKLDVVFYNSAGAYVTVPETVKGDEEYSKSAAITAAQQALTSDNNYTTTLTLKGVPSSASQIYIVANSKQGHSIETSSLDDAKKSMIYLKDQVKTSEITSFSGEESTMTGLGIIGTTSTEGIATANVSLRAVPSRIELQNLTAEPAEAGFGGYDIESFEVLGFYVNAFYGSGSLDPKQDADDRQQINYGSDKNKYSATAYNTAGWSIMCDEPAEETIEYAEGENATTLYTATTTNSNRWGYHVLQGVPPHVVVKLNVTDAGGQEAVKFLTINKYTFSSPFTDNITDPQNPKVYQSGDAVDKVLRGHVYQISNITFDVTHLTDIPYETTKTVTATVNVLPWIGVPVNPGFN